LTVKDLLQCQSPVNSWEVTLSYLQSQRNTR